MKVNKRIGKLKQWTGEKLGGQQKTELSEDFQSLEQDVELRKAGVERMYSVSKEYSKHMTRKVEADGTDTGKVLPIDGLGLVLAGHGDEFGHDSSFGQALMAFGKAQQQMATATANYTDHLNSGWLTSLEKSIAQMAEYTNQRKKLDSRRLTYDAMLAKVQKSKKEKRELEDDLRVAKNRYEETSEEVQERAVAIQDSEAEQMVALSRLLEIQSVWIDEQKRILDDVKRHWVDPTAFKSGSFGSRKKGTAHSFGIEHAPAPKPSIKSKSAGSAPRQSRHQYSDDEDDLEPERADVDDEDAHEQRSPPQRPRPAVTTPLKPRSSAPHRESLGREKPGISIYNGASRYGGVRIPGMPPPGASSVQSDESLSPMHDGRRANGATRQHPSSPTMKRAATAPSTRAIKWMKAKWAYSATEADELELAVGDRVRVTSEINAEWFVGRNEATGLSGMFPSAYCVTEEDHKSGMPEADDTFADPEEGEESGGPEEMESAEDESEGAALRQSQSRVAHKPSPSMSSSVNRPPSFGGKVNNSTTASGKRAPPPPPTRRATATTTSSMAGPKGANYLSSSTGPCESPPNDDQPEAFGSVSELKKRLGMFK